MFLGYPDGVKGYRLWRVGKVSPKVIVSRIVVLFKEDVLYKHLVSEQKNGTSSVSSGSLPSRSNEVQIEVETEQVSESEEVMVDVTDQEESQISLRDYKLARDRQRRKVQPPPRFRSEEDISAYVFVAAEEEASYEPLTFKDAINSKDKRQWLSAMEEEMASLYQNNTWELVDKPKGKKLVDCKWVYKLKDGILV